jgi:hypothetical protein
MMKKQFDANLRKQTVVLREALEDLLNEKLVEENPESAEFYDRLKDTFNAFVKILSFFRGRLISRNI